MRVSKLSLLTLPAVAALLATAPTTQAGLVFTIEGPGVQSTTVGGASTEDFESAPSGNSASYASPNIDGTYSPIYVDSVNVYGGAGGAGQYNLQGLGTVASQTLTFNNPKTYFGLWWSAGDAGNQLSFYDGLSLLASYQVGDIIPHLSPGYYGNPNSGGNTGEPYVYLNFTTTGSSRITSVVFDNPTWSGFESDNHSVYDQVINPPGRGIPDAASTLGLLGLAASALVVARRRTT